MNMHATIADLERQFATLLGEYPELADDEDLRGDVLDGETDMHGVLARLVNAVAEANMMIEGIKARRQDLAARADRFEMKVDALRGLIARVMTAADVSKVTLPEATLSVRDAPQKLVEVDAAETPDEFWRVRREVDKKAIADALKHGNPVAGWALSNGGRTLTIRGK